MAQSNQGAPVRITNDTNYPIPVTSGGSGGTADQVQGNIASGAADSGNPVKTGGRASNSLPAGVSSGQRVNTWLNPYGGTVVSFGLSQSDSVALLPPQVPYDIDGFARALGVMPLLTSGGVIYHGRGDSAGAWVKAPPLTGTDRSLTTTTTSQQLMAANASRSRILIRNDAAQDVYVNFGGTAVASAGAGNFKIAANGGSLDLTGTSSAINIIAQTGTPAISAREW